MEIPLTDLEDAINFWRQERPARGEERALSREVDALATVYARMIHERARSVRLDALDDMPRQLLIAWRAKRA